MKTFLSVLLVFLISLLPDVNQEATFVVDVTQSSYEAEENHSITLEWTFSTRTQGSYRELFIICELSTPVKTRTLYVYRNGVEVPDHQDEQFSGRVHSDKDVLREGRIRLHVSRLRTNDSGLYLCDVKTEDGFGSAECRLKVSGSPHLTGSDEPIRKRVGADVVLPCHVEPSVDVRDTSVKWIFNSSKTVHLFRSGDDDPKNQDKRYSGRTYLNHTMLKHGDISLKVTNLTKEDDGNYTCIIRRLPGHDKSEERNVTLVVVDENENPDGSSGGPDAGRIGGVGVVLLLLLLLAFIIYCVVRHRRGEQIFPCLCNKSRHERGRNDGDRRRNDNRGDEGILHILGYPNQNG